MTEQKFLPYARQSISQEDIENVASSLTSPIITRGSHVEDFEEGVASYCGAAYAVAFNSGTSALMAAYFAADVAPNDKLITTPNTFISTVGSAVARGASPIFIDIDRTTGNLNMQDLLDNINQPMTRGKQIIAPVHFAGIPVDMQTLDRSIAGINTVVIEDAAHAIGSCYLDGTRVGSSAYSDMTIFSFHPAKTITTGEGGMVTTNNEHYYRMLKLFRNNGIEREQPFLTGTAAPWYYEAQALTGNFNFTDFQAALGLSQLRRIPQFVAKRKKLMETYRELLKGYDHIRLLMPQQEHVAHHLCVVEINIKALKTTRTAIMEKLKERGIGSQYHYIPIYRHPSIASLVGDIAEYFPQMEKYYPQALSLPLYFDLTEDDVEYVVKNLLEITK